MSLKIEDMSLKIEDMSFKIVVAVEFMKQQIEYCTLFNILGKT
jgi:hypothetical protein